MPRIGAWWFMLCAVQVTSSIGATTEPPTTVDIQTTTTTTGYLPPACEPQPCSICGPSPDVTDVKICPCQESFRSQFCPSSEPVAQAEQMSDNCQVSPVQERAGNDIISVSAICPTRGPLVGGTTMFIWGQRFGLDPNSVEVMVGPHRCTILEMNTTMIECATSPAPSETKVALPVIIQLTSGSSITLPKAYMYRGQPQITAIEPTKTFLKGGIPLTVSGRNLNSTTVAILEVTMIYKLKNKSVFPSKCSIVSDSKMLCLTPHIHLPLHLRDTRDVTSVVRRNGNSILLAITHARNDSPLRIRRASASLNVLDLEFYLGFQLGGTATYDTVDAIPGGQLEVYRDPVIHAFEEEMSRKPFRPGWPEKQEHIEIKGEHLNEGCQAKDYTVTIGASECTDVQLFVDFLTCIPPPKSSSENMPFVWVRVGNIYTSPGSLLYQTNLWQVPIRRTIIMAVICIVIAIIIIAVIVRVVIIRRPGKARMPEMRLNQDEHGMSEYLSINRDFLGSIAPSLRLEISEFLVRPNWVEKDHVTLRGKYGVVYFGWLTDRKTKKKAALTMKSIQDFDVTLTEMSIFLQEAMALKQFDHPHVLPVSGICILGNLPHVLYPFMANGSLKPFLQNHKESLTETELIQFGRDIARGMKYLTEQKFVHKDLATRNCVVDKDNCVKIADYGLSKDLYTEDYFTIQPPGALLPVRWMAVESVQYDLYTSKTDVWSYGVVLWEIFSGADMPYTTTANNDVIKHVTEGNKLDKPATASDAIYNLMCSCWLHNTEDRPNFAAIWCQVESLLGNDVSDELSTPVTAEGEDTMPEPTTLPNGLEDHANVVKEENVEKQYPNGDVKTTISPDTGEAEVECSNEVKQTESQPEDHTSNDVKIPEVEALYSDPADAIQMVPTDSEESAKI